MRAQIAALLFLLSTLSAAKVANPVPKMRESLSGGDWFPYVFAKIAPLEKWNVVLSSDDIVREHYASESEFAAAKRNTWAIPRFCFAFFRPSARDFLRLLSSVDRYQGAVFWSYIDGCLQAFQSKATFYGPIGDLSQEEMLERLEDAIRNPPKADPEFVKKAIADIPNFCMFVESQLGLRDRSPQDFDSSVFAKEKLAESPGTFEDFFEPGDFMPILKAPGKPMVGRNDRPNFGISSEAMNDLLTELGADWGKTSYEDLFVPDYPLLSRLSDIANTAVYQPAEINRLLAEVLRAQGQAKYPSSIRTLDKLYRIVKWAERDETGIVFPGQ
jgi:hypothetical protein